MATSLPSIVPATVASMVANGHPLPSISPAAIAAATEQRANGSFVDLAVSIYGKRDVERQMKRGLVLAEDSPEGRIMEALVRLGYATKGRATRADRR